MVYFYVIQIRYPVDHFIIVCLVPQPSSECEVEVDHVLIQTSFIVCFLMEITLEKYELA